MADPNCGSIEVGEIVKVVGIRGIGRLVVPEAYELPDHPKREKIWLVDIMKIAANQSKP